MVDWSRYLESLCQTYAQWWQVYTITDVVGRKRNEVEPSPLLFDFGLMVQTVERDREERGKGEEKIERLTVLEGLRKYASEHVLLVGRPGSGKSSALVRLVLEEAQKGRTPLNPPLVRGEEDFVTHSFTSNAQESLAPPLIRGAGGVKIPVLVELRYYHTSILDLIQDFLQRHDPNLTVDAEMLKIWLRQGQLLLLVDGVNELPSEDARRDLQKFRQDYQQTTRMIFTTRDLGVGGDLGIAKKLEMQPLSEVQMQQFVRAYLPQQGEQMLRQLGSRLREFGQTPLLLWMLCSLFRAMGKVPPNLGLVFRQFAQSYYGKLKQDVPVTEESRDWCQLLLERLAFRMTQGREKTELQVAISKQEAEEILTAFLRDEGLEQPRNRALKWLKDLLKHHLIQLGAGEQIEFRHQLIQEYYTAEYLLKVLTPPRRTSPPTPLLRGEGSNVPVPPFPGREAGALVRRLGGLGFSDDELKREYLNYLKWTEPLALMLELVEDEAQAVRVVKLALEVDLRLGARLAGEVKQEWQEQTVGFVTELDVPQLLKIQLLSLTQSEQIIPELVKALNHEDSSVRRSAAEALGKIGSNAAIPKLVKALEDKYFDVRRSAAEALGKIGSDAAIPQLVKALKHENYDVRSRAAEALGKTGSNAAIPQLVKALKHENYDVRVKTAYVLGKIGSDAVIPQLVKALEDKYFDVRWRAVNALGEIGSDVAIPQLVKALQHEDSVVRFRVVYALGEIGSDAVIPELVKALEHKDSFVRLRTADALGHIGSDAAISELVKILEHKDYGVRLRAAEALGKLGSDVVISQLVKALEHEEYVVRFIVAEALGNIGSDMAIPQLVKALEDENSVVRLRAAEALGKIGSDTAIPQLVKTLEDEDSVVRFIVAEALGNIGSDAAISELVKALEDEDSVVRWRGAKALGNIGSAVAILELVKALDHEDYGVRFIAIYALGKIGSDTEIPQLLKALKDEDYDVRWRAAAALGNIGSDAAIPQLVKALEHEHLDVRRSAAEALGNIGSVTAIPQLVKALEHEHPDVRRSAAESLGKIGSVTAIPQLVDALKDKDCDVRRSVAEALGKIGSDAAMPKLVKTLEDKNFVQANDGDTLKQATEALQSIQNRCKFYNPSLIQPIFIPEPQLNIPPIQPISTSLMHILHLSDLHFGTLDQANLWSNQLAADLYNDLSIPHLDALILSGDIANYSTQEEYIAAQQFLHNLRQDFPLKPEQIILVPGNHDLNWKLAKKAYKLIDRDDYDGELQDSHYIEESASVIRVRDETEYKQRFAHFSSFYETIKQKPYPLDYDQQYTLDHLKEQNLLILGLNSAWQLDHHYKSRASINTNALSNALTQIRRNPDYKNCLKIAVWHHPLDSAYSDRITDQGFLEQLAVNGFRFFLHGHIHKAETSLFRYDMSTNGRKLDRICAGTFGAPVREWVPGYPLQYNLLKIEDNQLTVYTRRREQLNGAWKPDARWLQGAGKTPLDYYAIEL